MLAVYIFDAIFQSHYLLKIAKTSVHLEKNTCTLLVRIGKNHRIRVQLQFQWWPINCSKFNSEICINHLITNRIPFLWSVLEAPRYSPSSASCPCSLELRAQQMQAFQYDHICWQSPHDTDHEFPLGICNADKCFYNEHHSSTYITMAKH